MNIYTEKICFAIICLVLAVTGILFAGVTNWDSIATNESASIGGNLTVNGNTLIKSDKQLQFRDVNSYIYSPDTGSIRFIGDSEFTGDMTADYISADTVKQGRAYMVDDFCERFTSLANTKYSIGLWDGGGTSGTQAIADVTGGVMRLSTGSTGSQSSTLTYAGSGFANADEWDFKTVISTDALTNRKIESGMRASANDFIVLRFDTAVDTVNLYLVTRNNGVAEVVKDTGIDLVAGEKITVDIEVASDNTYELFINGTAIAITSPGTISDAAFKPYFYIDNKAVAQDNQLDIDTVEVRQSR